MADYRRKKKRGRSKIFRSCFRSFAADERPFSYYKSDGLNTKNGRLGKPVLIAVSGRQGKDFIPDVNLVNGGVTGSGVDCYAQRSSHRRRISRLFKAILFDSLMVKKIRTTPSKSSIASDTSESFYSIEKMGKSSDDSNAWGRESTDMEDSCSRHSNLLSSSSRTTCSSYSISSSSSTNSNSRSSSDQKTSSPIDLVDFRHPISSTLNKPNLINSSSQSCFDQKVSSRIESLNLRRQDTSISLSLAKPKRTNYIPQSSSHHKGLPQLDSVDSGMLVSSNSLPLPKVNPDKIKSGGDNWNIRWCLFLFLSLVVLVIYGRIYSILCTSTWFYFVPCRRVKQVNSVTKAAKFLDTESAQYKKRVIMAGLLDRTRNPLR